MPDVIGRPQPDDVATAGRTSDLSVGVRAGFWRRLLALAIDSLIISVLFQLMVAVLFVATSGRIQIHGDVTYTSCSKRQAVPDALVPPPPAGSNFARECNISFLGAQTARILQVGLATQEGTLTKAGSQSYMLDRDGRPFDGAPVDWIAILALLAYLVAMETRTGATLGSRAMAIRVIDVAAPAGPRVRLRKIVMRYLAMLIGFLPILAGLLVYWGLFGSPDDPYGLFLKSMREVSFIAADSEKFRWHLVLGRLLELPAALLGDDSPSFGKVQWLFDTVAMVPNGWAVFLSIQIAMKRDPLYDRMAGTAVVRVLRDHQGDRTAH